jgi:hypothetical protein
MHDIFRKGDMYKAVSIGSAMIFQDNNVQVTLYVQQIKTSQQ